MWQYGEEVVRLMQIGALLEIEGNTKEALQFYQEMLPSVSNLPSTFGNTPEYRSWSEILLSRYCTLAGRHVVAIIKEPSNLLSPNAIMPPASILAPFRAYAKDWDARTLGRTARVGLLSQAWQAYYNTLSLILQNGMLQPMLKSKLELSAELKSVEAMYETVLLKEVKFPRADQVNSQIESWVDLFMANWRVLCEPTWRIEDLAEVDKSALSRRVLDVSFFHLFCIRLTNFDRV